MAPKKTANNGLLTVTAVSSLLIGTCAFALPAQSQKETEWQRPTAITAQEHPASIYGQPAGSALDQASPALPGSTPQYGQPAGSFLDQPLPPADVTKFDPNQPALPPMDMAPNLNLPSTQVAPPPANQPVPPGHDQCPIDIDTLKLRKLEIDLQNAEFMNSTVGALHLIVNDLDCRNGSLDGLSIDVRGAQFQDIAFDQLTIATQGPLAFDRSQFLGHKKLEFTTPATAQVTVVVSQDSLNKFLNSPQTLQRLSGFASEKVRGLASLLRSSANVGINLSEASVLLQKGNRVTIAVKAQIGMGGVGLPIPLSLQTKLGLNGQGWIDLSDTRLNANGQELPPALANMVVKKFNEMADWGKMSEDIKFSFSQLKVVPNKQFIIKGTAQVARLTFGEDRRRH